MATRKKNKTAFFPKLFFLAFAVFALSQVVSFQLEIAAEQERLQLLEKQVREQQIENKDIERLLEMEDNTEYLERIAIERLGFAYSDEKIYIDISGS